MIRRAVHREGVNGEAQETPTCPLKEEKMYQQSLSIAVSRSRRAMVLRP
jgi:hypothetical protein